jgi:hypothetical protein
MFKRLLLGSFKQLRIMAKSRKAEATKIRNATKASATAPIPASAFVSAAVPVPKHRPVEKLPPLVIVSSCEHHSNLLVWRECGAEVKVVGAIPETGLIDLVQLETLLKVSDILFSFSLYKPVLFPFFLFSSRMADSLHHADSRGNPVHLRILFGRLQHCCSGPAHQGDLSPHASVPGARLF